MILRSRFIMLEFLFIFTDLCFQGFADELMFNKVLRGENSNPDVREKLDHHENVVKLKVNITQGNKSKQPKGKEQSQNYTAGTNEAGVAKQTSVQRAKFYLIHGNTSIPDGQFLEGDVINGMAQIFKIEPNTTNEILDTIQTTGGVVGKGLLALVKQWDKTLIFAAVLGLCIVAGYYIGLISQKFIRVRKPKLVFETSRIFILEVIKQPIYAVTKAVEYFHKSTDPLLGVALAPALESRLRAIAIATKSAHKNKGFYRNLLLLGPDGTGKTSVAKNLAKYCGLDFAIVLGSAVASFDTNAVDTINEIFDWAHLHIKGVLLFINRADVFLQKRTSDKVSNDLKAAIDVFLYRTSAPSNSVMLVLASNAPEKIDQAVFDRLNQIINFELPGEKERGRIIHGYFDKFILKPNRKIWMRRRLVMDQVDLEAVCSKLAARTAGMSGRALSKFGVAWQAAASASADGRLTKQMCIKICDDVVREHEQMMKWLSDEEKRQLK